MLPTKDQIEKILTHISSLLPEYLANDEDMAKGNGNVAVCIIDAEGNVYGKRYLAVIRSGGVRLTGLPG